MIDKEQLQSRTPEEIFGPEGGAMGRRYGAQRFYRVSSDIAFVEQRVKEKGLKIDGIKVTSDRESFYVISEGERVVLSLQSEVGENQGIWIDNLHLDEFQELIGVEEPQAK